ncbi:TolC family protein [Pontiella sp. NLcol2]|uniref:TolC family protein n=2 Tax=Pontiella agarivorans TaxID=3038953 RepID=A0ABU5MX39_9BACT|nr:TolC family protein [Pontiella agarivorans]
MIKTAFGTLGGVFVFSLNLYADTNRPAPPSLSLEQAVLMGLQHNRGLQVQQFNPVIAGAFEQLERGVYDPEFFASFSDTEENVVETSTATVSQFQNEGSDTEGAVGIRQQLPTGTEVEASVSSERSISTRSPEQQTARLGLTVTQQLLRGFGPSVNLASIRQAELETEASRYELRGYTEAVIADIEMAYWRYVAAREAIRVVKSSLEIAQSQLEEVESRIEVGDLPENEAAAARAEVALSKQNLIDAQSAMEKQRYTLLRLVQPNLSVTEMQALEAVSSPDVDVSREPDAEESILLALQSRSEIKEAELQLQRGELETVVTRNGRLPKLELFINLGKTGYADTFDDSFKNLDGPGYDVTVGLEFSQALGNRQARARDIIARTELEQGKEALANLRDLVRFDVLLALNELKRARLQVSASTETRGYREQTLQAERDRFEVGTATALDVALTQRDLLQSRLAEIEARVAFMIARIRLFQAEGTLIERRGLSIDSVDREIIDW